VDPVSRESGVAANAELRAGAMGVAGSEIVAVGVSDNAVVRKCV
jgi:hypothetical protein